MHLVYPTVLASALFCVGLYGVLARRNAILMLMSVELMLNAVNVYLVAFDAWLRDTLHTGQALTLFTIAVAAAEIGIGLAVVLLVYRNRGSSAVDRLRDLREPVGPEGAEEADEAEVAASASELTEPGTGESAPAESESTETEVNDTSNDKPGDRHRPQPGGRHTA